MARNPYQLDPYFAQGLANLTTALIGNPETDYQVARTNRINTLLPLEQQQIQSNIAGNKASQAAALALEKLRKAQTLTEDQLRDPRVQKELAEAKAILAQEKERLGAAAANNALADQRNALTPEMVLSEKALAASRNADAGAADALANQRNELTPSMVSSEDALAASRNADAGAADALAKSRIADALLTEAKTRPTVDKIAAETSAATALANERNTSADLNKTKTEKEKKIILNAGQTLVSTDANGKQQTYTAPETVEVTLEAGEEATIIKTDGTQTQIKGPAKTPDPDDNKKILEELDNQFKFFFDGEKGIFNEVPNAVLNRIRSSFTNSAMKKGTAIGDAAALIQDKLSRTVDGQAVFYLRKSGTNIYIPAFIAADMINALRDRKKINHAALAKMYGLSKKDMEELEQQLRKRPDAQPVD